MNWASSHNSGLALIELLLALSIFSLFAFAFVGASLYGQESSAAVGDRARATLLADEGMQAVRAVRNRDFNALSAGTYDVSISGGAWQLQSGSDTIDGFTREIDLESVTSDVYRATVSVTWQSAQRSEQTVVLEGFVTNWQEEQGGGSPGGGGGGSGSPGNGSGDGPPGDGGSGSPGNGSGDGPPDSGGPPGGNGPPGQG